MPAVLEGAVPPPHLHLTGKSSWHSSYSPIKYPIIPSSSPLPMSPESLPPYIPQLHENPLPPQDLGGLPSSSWFGPSVPAPEVQNESGYSQFTYDQPYVTPHTSSITFSPPAQFPKPLGTPVSLAKDASVTAFSPASEYSKMSEPGHGDYIRASDESYVDGPRTSAESSAHLQVESEPPARPRSSPSTFTPNHPSSGPLDHYWTLNPLGISTSMGMHEQYYPGSTYPPPRRMYPPIAPAPNAIGYPRTSAPKRSREDDDPSEHSKRRKRSDSNTTMTMELREEERLLLQLKDEENMPWKDIQARVESDLGRRYEVPALQMKLKRLRERMRVWTENDVRALRAAHDYWAQSKFEIISQKMLEFGASEKWTKQQCARKWAEIDPGPTPYTSYDHSTGSYAPYTMSPVEAPPYGMQYHLHMP
ncbi:hypothetical protein BCR34DRAFT_14992 [Clohesyomyces aquaticus]|uniref:Myb-like domain-containing protein n=1 Tax=Clohesyomyces aquaticus TaxID=1231657 RepID=A0A1Y1ZCT9_9PLEO|nr:hypothetical protein BCR34DRAFT_14992 [Clohesyomyces aquaticus]